MHGVQRDSLLLCIGASFGSARLIVPGSSHRLREGFQAPNLIGAAEIQVQIHVGQSALRLAAVPLHEKGADAQFVDRLGQQVVRRRAPRPAAQRLKFQQNLLGKGVLNTFRVHAQTQYRKSRLRLIPQRPDNV
ncbi:hypothetical protein D9M68_558970 [compost metagenome]